MSSRVPRATPFRRASCATPPRAASFGSTMTRTSTGACIFGRSTAARSGRASTRRAREETGARWFARQRGARLRTPVRAALQAPPFKQIYLLTVPRNTFLKNHVHCVASDSALARRARTPGRPRYYYIAIRPNDQVLAELCNLLRPFAFPPGSPPACATPFSRTPSPPLGWCHARHWIHFFFIFFFLCAHLKRSVCVCVVCVDSWPESL